MQILKHILTLLLVKLPLQLVGIPILAVTLFLKRDDTRILSPSLTDQRLPKLLRWFDVGDELDKRYGLNGDMGYQTSMLSGLDHVSDLRIWFMRFNWLALRNPINNFQYSVLGLKKDDIANVDEVYRNPDMPIGDYDNAGYRRVNVSLKNGKKASEYYLVYLYPVAVLGKRYCFRTRIGHKLGEAPLLETRDVLQWVFSVNPIKEFKGNV